MFARKCESLQQQVVTRQGSGSYGSNYQRAFSWCCIRSLTTKAETGWSAKEIYRLRNTRFAVPTEGIVATAVFLVHLRSLHFLGANITVLIGYRLTTQKLHLKFGITLGNSDNKGLLCHRDISAIDRASLLSIALTALRLSVP